MFHPLVPWLWKSPTFHLCTEAIWWTFGISFKVCFCWSSSCSYKLQSCRSPHILPHWMETPLCKYAKLCKSLLRSCKSGSASPVPGAGILLLCPMWFSGQDLRLWSTAMVNPYWALLAGFFPALCLWQPLQSSLKLGISLSCGFQVNLPSQASEASVFIWKW